VEIRRRKKILDVMASGDAKGRKLFPAWLEDTEEAELHNTMDVKARHSRLFEKSKASQNSFMEDFNNAQHH